MITVETGAMEKVHEQVEKLGKVRDSVMLTGNYDVMTIARAEDMAKITNTLVEDIRNIDGVRDTVTCVFIE